MTVSHSCAAHGSCKLTANRSSKGSVGTGVAVGGLEVGVARGVGVLVGIGVDVGGLGVGVGRGVDVGLGVGVAGNGGVLVGVGVGVELQATRTNAKSNRTDFLTMLFSLFCSVGPFTVHPGTASAPNPARARPC